MTAKFSVQFLRELFDYSPETGELIWRRTGRIAGTIDDKGYRRICIRRGLVKQSLRAHQIAFAIVHGRWPSEVDHINTERTDNRIANLREVTRSQNVANSRPHKNKFLPKGVSYWTARRKYVAQLGVDYRIKYLGLFDTPEEAAEAYRVAALAEFGEYSRVK